MSRYQWLNLQFIISRLEDEARYLMEHAEAARSVASKARTADDRRTARGLLAEAVEMEAAADALLARVAEIREQIRASLPETRQVLTGNGRSVGGVR